MLELIKWPIYSLPALVLLVCIALLIIENWRANPKIEELRVKFDPDRQFIWRSDYRMWFMSNKYYLNEKHPLCTEDFLTDWDSVYGKHWRRMYFGFVMTLIVVYLSRVTKYFLIQYV
jgi:hypothetical protein